MPTFYLCNPDTRLADLPGLGPEIQAVFHRAGYTLVGDVLDQQRHIYRDVQTAIDDLRREELDTLQPADRRTNWFLRGSLCINVVESIRISMELPFFPPAFMCPITGGLMNDPVIAQSGYTYERSAIQAIIDAGEAQDPPVAGGLLIPNRALREAIQHYRDYHLRYSIFSPANA